MLSPVVVTSADSVKEAIGALFRTDIVAAVVSVLPSSSVTVNETV